MGLKDFLKEAFDEAKETSGFNDSVKNLKKELGIDILKDFKYSDNKNYLHVKVPSLSLKSMGGILAGNISNIENFGNTYRISDLKGDIKYLSDYDISLVLDKESITLYDSEKNKIGKVKEYPLSVGVPFFEKEVKKCGVYLKDRLICKLKKFESFGELGFETIEGSFYIKYDKRNPCEFIIRKNKKNIGKIYAPSFKLKDEFIDKYLIEYDDVLDEKIVLLMTLALDVINY